MHAINLLNNVKTVDKVDVNSSVEISIQIYTLLKNIPNIHLIYEIDKTKKDTTSAESISLLADSDDASNINLESNQEIELPNLPEHVGEFKPDLVELITYAKNQQNGIDSNASGFDQMQLEEFLKQTTELNVAELSEGEFSEYSNLFTNNLMDLSNANFDKQKKIEVDLDSQDLRDGPISQSKYINERTKEFFYDEWNFRSRDYKPAWCRVLEKELDFGEVDYYDQILSEHSKLIKETKRKFEYLKPESMHKEKRLEDGDEIDLDRLVDFYAEKLAGYSPLADFYSKRNKIERDVAVALLLDMSASTDEIIEKDASSSNQYNQYSGAPGTYFRWLASRNSEKSFNTNKRIIDIEKESAIVLSEALDSIGDNYGLYGFSGYGRDNVEYFVIKDIGEKLDKNVHRKIANIQPVRSTRMGPAIRHTIQKLELSSSKIKIMIMLSDGRPQDHEYGKDRTEKAYAIHDTRQALLEAKHKGITPFLLTVDKDGHDYLQEMCNDIGYEVVSDIDSLPERLTNLYKKISVK
jgi:nitric oxide reductase activation protein